jgi:flap endonuclease-1
MGTAISSILQGRETSIKDLAGKKLVLDAYNQLYQYLSTIRQPDGSLLMDSRGNVTSHLSGLFFRTVNMLENGIRLAFVFDGVPPTLKNSEIERRKEIKEKAELELKRAKDLQDVELMNKYAKRTSRLTKDMVDEAKELLVAMGIPCIDAPSEAEAQAAYMVKTGDFFAVVSQDADSLLFGAPKVVKNLTISSKRKIAGSPAQKNLSPEIIDLSENINLLGIGQDQLIALGMLVGTDFNIGGIKGIGPKKGLELVKRYGNDFESLFKEVGWSGHFSVEWKEVYSTIKNMPTIDVSPIWPAPELEKVKRILIKHEFSEDRVDSAIKRIGVRREQRGLNDFFS